MAKGKGKKNGNKERASVSRERRIALALVALLDAIDDTVDNPDAKGDEVTVAKDAAAKTLEDLGYESLEGIPRRLRKLNEQLTAAVAAGDGATIARIGAEMVKVQAGKEPVAAKAAAGGE